jgi:hypothetical protein
MELQMASLSFRLYLPSLIVSSVMPMVGLFLFYFSWIKLRSKVHQLVPTINGYKRLVGGEAFWAPNAITYGYDSRAASIRIISPPSVPPAATRLEVRIPGADMNPYFALSAIFLLGLRGIERNLELTSPPISHFTPEDRNKGKVRRPFFSPMDR